MIKKFTLLLLAMLCIAGTSKAETKEIEKWSSGFDAYGNICIDKSNFSEVVEGDILRIYLKLTENGRIYPSYKKGNYVTPEDWDSKPFSGWANMESSWLNSTDKYYDIQITSGMVEQIKNYYLYISSGSSVSKVSLLHNSSNQVSHTIIDNTKHICTANYWENKIDLTSNTDIKNAKKNDILKVTLTPSSNSDFVIRVTDASETAFSNGVFSYKAATGASEKSFYFPITNAKDLETIQASGIKVMGGNCTITNISLYTCDDSYDAVPVTIGSDGIATWSSSKNADFSGVSGVTPYYASEVSKGQVTLTAVESTRAWVGYIVKGDEGTYDVPVGSEPAWIDAFNNLTGTGDNAGKVYKSVYSDYTKQEDWESEAYVTNIKTKYRYIFAKHNGNIGFYLLGTDYKEGAGNNPYHTLAAHKAYLETDTNLAPSPSSPDSQDAPALKLIFGGGGEGTTGINTVSKNPVVEDGVYYNLQGVAVKNPSKGLYILNGKKVIVK